VTAAAPAGRLQTVLEALLAFAIVIALGVAVARFLLDGYLPQPFYYQVSDSFMDLYSTAYWANHDDAYDIWHSIYPPLSFIFLRLFSLHGCYRFDSFSGRDCDWLAPTVLCLFFALNIALVHKTYRLIDPCTAGMRTVAMAAGLPMLYALERGNLLIPCFTCFVLGYGNLLRAKPPRWLALALAVNFKPYLLVATVPFLVARRWSWLAGGAVAGLGVYLITLAIYGAGSPFQIIGNETKYAVATTGRYFADLYYATSFWPLIRMLRAAPTGLALVSPGVAGLIALTLTILLRGAQAGAAGCIAAAAFRPAAVDVRRFGAMIAALSLTTFTTGSAGDAQIFLFFLILFEPWRGAARIAILISTYLLCLPLDFAFLLVRQDPTMSFLGGRVVTPQTGVSFGQLARPAILLMIQYGLIVINFQDIIGDGRQPPATLFAKQPPPFEELYQ